VQQTKWSRRCANFIGNSVGIKQISGNAFSGMERNEKEWAKLFFDSGFLNYKIHPVPGTRAVTELYP